MINIKNKHGNTERYRLQIRLSLETKVELNFYKKSIYKHNEHISKAESMALVFSELKELDLSKIDFNVNCLKQKYKLFKVRTMLVSYESYTDYLEFYKNLKNINQFNGAKNTLIDRALLIVLKELNKKSNKINDAKNTLIDRSLLIVLEELNKINDAKDTLIDRELSIVLKKLYKNIK